MESKLIISNIGTRVLALLADIFIIGLLGFLLGLFFTNTVSSFGGYGHLLGLLITLVYLTICNSKYRSGQTWGKEFFNIQVVDKDGNFLDYKKSFLRSLILVAPYFLIKVSYTLFSNNAFIYTAIIIVLQSINLSIIFIYILNKKTRQSLHDLLIGTYVVTTTRSENNVVIEEPSKNLKYFFFAIFLSTNIYYVFDYFQNNNTSIVNEISDPGSNNIVEEIQKLNNGVATTLTERTTTTDGQTTTELEITFSNVDFDKENLENNIMVKKTIKYLINNITNLDNFNTLTIAFHQSFDIGIASSDKSFSISKPPKEWRIVIK